MIEALPEVFIDRLNGRCRYIFFLAIHCVGVQRQSKWQWFTNINIVILFKLTKTSTCEIHCLNFDFLFHMHLYISANFKINVIYINTISGIFMGYSFVLTPLVFQHVSRSGCPETGWLTDIMTESVGQFTIEQTLWIWLLWFKICI